MPRVYSQDYATVLAGSFGERLANIEPTLQTETDSSHVKRSISVQASAALTRPMDEPNSSILCSLWAGPRQNAEITAGAVLACSIVMAKTPAEYRTERWICLCRLQRADRRFISVYLVDNGLS